MLTTQTDNGTTYTQTVPPAVSTRSKGDNGAAMAKLVYLAYIGGFFVPLIAAVGVIVAYVSRDPAARFSPHFTFQIRTFWRGFLILLGASMLYLVLGFWAATGKAGLVTLMLPVGLMLWWFVSTIGRISRGLRALNRGEPSVS